MGCVICVMKNITAQEIRDIIFKEISPQIMWYRTAKDHWPESEYSRQEATEEEINDFIYSNPYYDSDLATHIGDPGLLGYSANNANVSEDWEDEFIEKTKKWKDSELWLGPSKLKFIHLFNFSADRCEFWTPELIVPAWLDTTPSYLLIAQNILNEGRCLSEMNWRDFENLIGILLENDGWKVEVTRGTKDGGIDVIAKKADLILGEIKTIWQAKKYHDNNFVSLGSVRELSAVREAANATKGIMVTTSRLTKGAIKWVQQNLYRLDYKEKQQIEEWVLGQKVSLG